MPYEKLIRYLNHDVEGSIDPDIYRAIESTVKRTPSGKKLDPFDLHTLLTINRDHALLLAEPQNAGHFLRAVDFKLIIIPEGTPQQEAVGDLLLFLDKHDGRRHVRPCDHCGVWYYQGQERGRKYCGERCKKALERAKKPAKARKVGKEKMRKWRLRQDVTTLLREAGKDGMNAEAIRNELNASAKRKRKVTPKQLQAAFDILETTGIVCAKKGRFCYSRN